MYPGQASDENPRQRNILLNPAAALSVIVVAVVSSVVFAFTPQILDIYRDIAQYAPLGPEDPIASRWQTFVQVWREPIFTIATALSLGVVLWMTAKNSLTRSRQNEALGLRRARQIRTFLPIVLAVLPLLALQHIPIIMVHSQHA